MFDGGSSTAAWIALGVAIAAITVALLLLWRRARQGLRPVRPPAPRGERAIQPVVLVHGLLGFDEMRVGPLRYRYFRSIPEALAGCGVRVHCVRLPALSSVPQRARRLATFVSEVAAEQGPVNIIAHSMGGLDARYAVSLLDQARSVCSITTIGSPHRGTLLADVGTEVLLDKLALRPLLRLFDVDPTVFEDLTVRRMQDFNRQVVNAAQVSCGSVVAAIDGSSRLVSHLLLPCFLYLQRRAGANDGLVPRESQPWGDVLAEVQADHLAQIGWSRRFDAAALYVDLVRELRGRSC